MLWEMGQGIWDMIFLTSHIQQDIHTSPHCRIVANIMVGQPQGIAPTKYIMANVGATFTVALVQQYPQILLIL
ncbi:MAG: hypothetical protein LBH25_11530 [Fibromonadaceae bacterium]|jgi:hypothetical protein|nr:hypothetical protein [Fibromonadaceae bacterium]